MLIINRKDIDMNEIQDYVRPDVSNFKVIFDAWRQNNRAASEELTSWLDYFLPNLMSSTPLWITIVGFLAYQIQGLNETELARIFGEKKGWEIRKYGVLNTYNDDDIRIIDLIPIIQTFCIQYTDETTGNRPLITYLERSGFFESEFNQN
jgi:hypothetical protein